MTRRALIPIAKPVTGEAEAKAVRRPILSGWLTQGPEVAAFEREFAALVGAPYACAVSNCTTALHLALLAVGVKPGDEVITVSHSYIATANSVRYCGAEPIFIDIDLATSNMDPEQLAGAITPKTRAIVCVHQMGMPCDVRAIVAVARAHGLPVVEDAACASGSAYVSVSSEGPEPVGRPHGDVAVFSFHPRKVISTGDGGMITTHSAQHDQMFRLLRQHGMSTSDRARHSSPQVVFEEHSVLGYNYRMTDIQAAVGREQLKRLPDIVAERRRLARHYVELLGSIPGLGVPHEPAWARSNWQSFWVELPDGIDQRTAMQALLDRGVATRRGIMNAHRERPYHGPQRHDLSRSERAQDRRILIPLFAQLTSEDQLYVVESIAEICRA